MTKRLLALLCALLLVPALLLDTDGTAAPPKDPAKPKDKKGKDKKEKDKKPVPKKPPAKKGKKPDPGKVYAFRPDAPGWATCDVEFRDPSEKLWPNFFYGRPASAGTFTYDPKKPKASFALNCDSQAQRNGDQGRRALGELLKDGNSVTVLVTVNSLGAPRSENAETVDDQGRTTLAARDYAPANLVVQVGGNRVAVRGKATYTFTYPKNPGDADSVYLDVSFKVKGSDLGLTKVKGNLECRAGVTGYATQPGKKPPKKR
jgi:hypothetical protein